MDTDLNEVVTPGLWCCLERLLANDVPPLVEEGSAFLFEVTSVDI
jgi:hypothetical protein